MNNVKISLLTNFLLTCCRSAYSNLIRFHLLCLIFILGFYCSLSTEIAYSKSNFYDKTESRLNAHKFFNSIKLCRKLIKLLGSLFHSNGLDYKYKHAILIVYL